MPREAWAVVDSGAAAETERQGRKVGGAEWMMRQLLNQTNS